MKKKSFTIMELLFVILFVIMILALFLGILLPLLYEAGEAIKNKQMQIQAEKEGKKEIAKAKEQKQEKGYEIEYLSSEVIRVVAEKYRGGLWDNERSAGQIFAEAIKEVSKKYNIKQITSVNNRDNTGSLTGEILLIVELREKVEAEVTDMKEREF